MEIKIGVQNSARELTLDSSESADFIATQLTQALKGEGGVLQLADTKGRTVIVPASAVAYVELGEETHRTIGFVGH